MRTEKRRRDPGLNARLLDAPQAFEFFQAVRLLERELHAEGRRAPDGGSLVSEQIRFRNTLSLSFPPSQVEALSRVPPGGGGEPGAGHFEMTPSFMGLLGLSGALPVHYTERLVAHECLRKDAGPRAFLDMFSNRLLGLFYQAWKKHRLPLQYESDRRDGFVGPLLALTGLGFESLRDRLGAGEAGVDDESVAHLAGLFAHRPVSAATLQTVLGRYFEVPVRIEQFVGHWYVLESAQHSRLGQNNCALGRSAMSGARVWQRNLRVRIRIGPLSHADHQEFLPGGRSAAALDQLLRLASTTPFEYQICPLLRAADVVPVRLGVVRGTRLGHDSFLCTRPAERDRDDAAFQLKPTPERVKRW